MHNSNDVSDINIFKERIKYKFDKNLSIFIDSSFVKFNLILLDIYYILRNLKTSYSKKNKKYKSLLSIGYFGARHTRNVIDFFLNSFYDTIYINDYNENLYKNNKELIRCIKIDKDINLNNIINDMYKEYNNDEDIITEYDNKIIINNNI
jgi:hypothetical protein